MLQQRGFTLIEVLVATLVITLGLMGVVVLQVGGQSSAFQTHQRTLAGLYAQDLQARLNADICILNFKFSSYSDEISSDKLNEFKSEFLDVFIAKQNNNFKDEHFVGSRSSWKSDLTVNIKIQEGSGGIDVYSVVENGYWEFSLVIKPSAAKDESIEQTIIVRYLKDGCSK